EDSGGLVGVTCAGTGAKQHGIEAVGLAEAQVREASAGDRLTRGGRIGVASTLAGRCAAGRQCGRDQDSKRNCGSTPLPSREQTHKTPSFLQARCVIVPKVIVSL